VRVVRLGCVALDRGERVTALPVLEQADVVVLAVPVPVVADEVARLRARADREAVAAVLGVGDDEGGVDVAIAGAGLRHRREAPAALADVLGAVLVAPAEEDGTPGDAVLAVPTAVLLLVRAGR